MVQIAAVDGGVADGAEQRQVGRDGAGGQALAGQVAPPGGNDMCVQLGQRQVAEAGRMRAVSLLLVPSAERGWAGFQAGHQIVVTYSPNSIEAWPGESWSENAT